MSWKERLFHNFKLYAVTDLRAASLDELKKIEKAFQAGNATEHTYRLALQELLETFFTDITVTNEPKRVACGAPDLIVTHKQILSAVWGPAHAADTQYLRVYIGQLRQKIEADPGDPHVIITEPGIGYRVAEPAEG